MVIDSCVVVVGAAQPAKPAKLSSAKTAAAVEAGSFAAGAPIDAGAGLNKTQLRYQLAARTRPAVHGHHARACNALGSQNPASPPTATPMTSTRSRHRTSERQAKPNASTRTAAKPSPMVVTTSLRMTSKSSSAELPASDSHSVHPGNKSSDENSASASGVPIFPSAPPGVRSATLRSQ